MRACASPSTPKPCPPDPQSRALHPTPHTPQPTPHSRKLTPQITHETDHANRPGPRGHPRGHLRSHRRREGWHPQTVFPFKSTVLNRRNYLGRSKPLSRILVKRSVSPISSPPRRLASSNDLQPWLFRALFRVSYVSYERGTPLVLPYPGRPVILKWPRCPCGGHPRGHLRSNRRREGRHPQTVCLP